MRTIHTYCDYALKKLEMLLKFSRCVCVRGLGGCAGKGAESEVLECACWPVRVGFA